MSADLPGLVRRPWPWREMFTAADVSLAPLGLTLPKPGQGSIGFATFPAGRYPACSEHGSMNRVAAETQTWRCLTCNVGGLWDRVAPSGGRPSVDTTEGDGL